MVLDERSCIRHIMSTSLEPQQAVESALSVAECINTCRYPVSNSSIRILHPFCFRLPDPELLRRTMREKQFSAKKCEPFKRRSFYDLGLHTEQVECTGEVCCTVRPKNHCATPNHSTNNLNLTHDDFVRNGKKLM